MATIDATLIKKVREATGAGVMRVKQVLEEVNGDEAKALEILKAEGLEKVAKREDRVTGQGKVFSYSHHSNKIVSVVELFSETDFVAKTDYFQVVGRDIAMQVCTEDYENIEELLASDYIKDPSKKISDLIEELTAKMGEKIEIKRFVKFSL